MTFLTPFMQLKRSVITKLQNLGPKDIGVIPEMFRTTNLNQVILKQLPLCDSTEEMKTILNKNFEEASGAYKEVLEKCFAEINTFENPIIFEQLQSTKRKLADIKIGGSNDDAEPPRPPQ
jgi:hypothetical protein